MARNKRRRGFYRPALQTDPLGPLAKQEGADSAALWAEGERQEEAFDYEAARRHYREAVRRAGAGDVRDWLTAYATFLVERYGQFAEVAAWLDDPAFDPLDGATRNGGLLLARLVLNAATETDHSRAQALDAQLARTFGEPASVGRLADSLLAAGDIEAARTLLNEHEARLPPLSRGAQLLRQLRMDEDAACEAALGDATQALATRDVGAARAALEDQRSTWAASARFRATEVHVAEAEQRAAAERLRARIETALDAEDLNEAAIAAEALCAVNPDSESDRATLSWLRQRLADQAVAAALVKAEGDTGVARLETLVALFNDHGQDVVVPAALAPAWALVTAAFDVLPATVVTDGADQLMAIAGLRDALKTDDLSLLAAGMVTLTGAWRQVDTARAASERLASEAEAVARREDETCAVTVRDHLAADQLDAARHALERRLQHGADGTQPLLRALRHELDEAAQRRQQRTRLAKDVEQNLKAGRLFAARRALATLEGIDDVGEQLAAAWRADLDERCMKELCAAPVPPFGLELNEGTVACTVAGQRLLIVQDRMWLTVNLETRGVAPFKLPEGFPLDAAPAPRLGIRDGRARLVGLSSGRLIIIEQDGGAAPEVTNARALTALTRGDGQVLSWALEPDADVLSLLFAKAGDGGNPVLVRIDADTLDVISHDRVKPGLASIAGVRGAAESLLAATTPDARRRGGWAVAQFGVASRPVRTWSQEDVAEPLAGFSGAVAWPEQDRIFAAYDSFELFGGTEIQRTPSLFVLRGDRIVFASSDLRKRFAPMERIFVDHAWTLDPAAGRLWFAALPREDHDGADAMLLGINARTLRPDPPIALTGVARVLAINAVDDGAAALCRTHEGRHAVARARVDERDRTTLTIDPLPV